MIEINLLPDVKQEYLRARRTRNLAISISILTGLASAGLVVLMLIVLGVQAGREALANNAINSEYSKLSSIDDLSELVTLRNQLDVVGSQHDKKSMGSRVFTVLQVINPKSPNDIQYTSVAIDPDKKTLTIEGIANNGYPAVEALIKTVNNTSIEYNSSDDKRTTKELATKVAIGDSSFSEDSQGRRVLRFEITVNYNELLFSNEAQDMRVLGPDRRMDVTDSRIGVPDSLFAASPEDKE